MGIFAIGEEVRRDTREGGVHLIFQRLLYIKVTTLEISGRTARDPPTYTHFLIRASFHEIFPENVTWDLSEVSGSANKHLAEKYIHFLKKLLLLLFQRLQNTAELRYRYTETNT